VSDLVHDAKARYEKIAKHQRSPRFKRVVGRLIKAKLFLGRPGFQPYSGKLSIKDYVWAGSIEPRILELLPALIIKKPSLFADLENCPKDLKLIVKEIRSGQASGDYHGIPAKSYLRWVSLVGHRGREASQLKSFRFSTSDSEILHFLRLKGYSEIGAVREGLRLLAERLR